MTETRFRARAASGSRGEGFEAAGSSRPGVVKPGIRSREQLWPSRTSFSPKQAIFGPKQARGAPPQDDGAVSEMTGSHLR